MALKSVRRLLITLGDRLDHRLVRFARVELVLQADRRQQDQLAADVERGSEVGDDRTLDLEVLALQERDVAAGLGLSQVPALAALEYGLLADQHLDQVENLRLLRKHE
jgi:hypothetical protein